LPEPHIEIRPAETRDAKAIAAIYNEGIADRVATFETRLRTPTDILSWLTDDLPVLVAERDGAILGWTRAGRHSDRPVYDGVGEHAVYVARSARGHGVGLRLLLALCAACEERGMHKLTGRLFTFNAASRAIHRSAGFREAGVLIRHARLDGEWKDVVVVERLLGDAVGKTSGAGTAHPL
jgi:phosphinothricin acetyltransferase